MKTLAATVPGMTERMGRFWLRELVLQHIAAGGIGIGWEIRPTHADLLMFGAESETRERWIDTADSDEFRRQLAVDWPDASPNDEAETMLAANQRFADFVVGEAFHLIDAPLRDRKSTTGEFLFQFNDDAIPVRVAYTREADLQRLELRFTATSEHRRSARLALDWRRRNPCHTAPVAPDEPVEDSAPRSRTSRWVDGFMWILTVVFSVITAFVFPLSTLFAFLWGFAVIPLCFRQLDRLPVGTGKMSRRAEIAILLFSFLALLFIPAIVCGFVLRTFEAGALFIPTVAGLLAFALIIVVWRRQHPPPELEPL